MTTTHPEDAALTSELERAAALQHAETAYRRFADIAGTVRDGEWDRPTDCDLWTVRDLVGHVVGAMRSAASVRELLSQQREIRARVRRNGANETDVMTQVQIDRTADLDTGELVAECRALAGPATAGRRRIPAPARRFVRFHVEMGSISETWKLGYLVDLILTRDAWLHRIDLCRALDREPELTAEHDGAVVAGVAHEWLRRHGRAVELVLTGPAGCIATSTTGAADPEHVELDAVEFCRTVSGRAPDTGLLAVEVPF